MADAGDGADPKGDEPLADVVAAIERRRSEREDHGGPWDRLDRGGDRDPEQVWDRLANGEVATLEQAEKTPTASSRASHAVEALSMNDKTVIGTTMALFLLAAGAVYLSATIGLLPGHLWILSLPLLAVGLVFLVPIATYELDIWDPADLGHDGVGERDTSDIPSPDSIDHE